MSEAWVLEVLADARDKARAGGLLKLAEHLDDAMLLAASEHHEALHFGAGSFDVREDTASAGEVSGRRLH
jgi:hypothetical protein